MQSHGISLPANAGFGGFRGGGGAGGVGGGAGNTSGTRPTTTLPAGVTSQQWNTALQACASSIPRGGTVNSTALANYRNCLNAYLETHGGTTLPTNGAGAGFGGGGFGGGGDGASGETTTTNPLMEAAQAHCASLRPAFGRGSTTTSTTV